MADLPDSEKTRMISRVDRIVDNVFLQDQENQSVNSQVLAKKQKDYRSQIIAVYFKVLEELLIQEEKKIHSQNFADILQNEQFHRALIACCIETTFFVNNYSAVSFVKLLELCDVQAFEFWRIITSFSKFDPHMPFPIKKHLYDLELKIITQLAWKKDSQVHRLIQQFTEASSSDNSQSQSQSSKIQSLSAVV